MSRRNILILLTDQQSAHMMSCAGNTYLSTPNMDRLAARAARFEGAYCSNPMCVPSRFTMFTGSPASAVGIHGSGTTEKKTVPEPILEQGMGWLAQKGGYRTLYGGKQHFPGGMTAENIGFEVFERNERMPLAQESARLLRELAEEKSDQPFLMVTSLINPHDICYLGLREFPSNDFEKLLVSKGTLEQTELDRALEQPEGVSDEEFFRDLCPPAPDNFEPQEDEAEAIQLELERRPFRRGCRERWDELDWRRHRWAYARLTEKVDEEIGVVLDALEETGFDQDTIVIFTSDHGDMSASHRLEHKDVPYEEACHVPLLIRTPEMDGASIIGREWMTSVGLDLVPTICEIARVDAPVNLRGESLLEPLRDFEGGRDFVPVESQVGHAIFGERYKLVRYFKGDPAEQWFDLEKDPGEMKSIDPAEVPPEIREEMEKEYQFFGLFQRGETPPG